MGERRGIGQTVTPKFMALVFSWNKAKLSWFPTGDVLKRGKLTGGKRYINITPLNQYIKSSNVFFVQACSAKLTPAVFSDFI